MICGEVSDFSGVTETERVVSISGMTMLFLFSLE